MKIYSHSLIPGLNLGEESTRRLQTPLFSLFGKNQQHLQLLGQVGSLHKIFLATAV